MLAAGASTRTSRPKPLFQVGAKPLVRHQIDRLHAAGIDHVFVVVGYHREAVCEAVGSGEGISIVTNRAPQRGMFSSVCEGIDALSDEGTLLIHPVDVLLPSPETVTMLLNTDAPIVIPTYCGRRGHPLILNTRLARTIPLSSHTRLDEWLCDNTSLITYVAVDEPAVVYNANTDAELAHFFPSEPL